MGDLIMPRGSSKKDKNVYFQRREELKLTREQASELLEYISPERIEKIENERVEPRPDEIYCMAEKYNSPELCNYYCSNQCTIGKQYVPYVKEGELSQIVLKMVAALNEVQDSQKRLINITVDGVIDDDEIADFVKIQDELEDISISVEALQLWVERMLNQGAINLEKYNMLRENKEK
jgi:aldehyde:ferredoxin oxidoreductase